MPEPARYTILVAKDAKQATLDMSKVLQIAIEAEQEKIDELERWNFRLFFTQFFHRHGLHLLWTTNTWFLLNMAFYSQNLFQKNILSTIGWIVEAETKNALEEVYKIVRA